MKLGAALLLFFIVGAAPEVRYFQYQRSVQNLSSQSGQACFAIDAGVFAHATSGLADLRLYGDGAETPYFIHRSEAVAGAQQTIALLNLGVKNSQTAFDAAMPDLPYSDVQLAVQGQNFIATVNVSGSQSQAGGTETKLGAYTIFDLSQQRLGRSTVLHIPKSDFRFLHFRVSGPLTPRDFSGLSVMRLPSTPPKFIAVAETSQVTVKDHSSILQFNVPAHVPVDHIVFAPAAQPALFSRDVTVSVLAQNPSAPPEEQETIRYPVQVGGSLLRIHTIQNGHRIDEEHLLVDTSLAENDLPTQWTITVRNGDDAPLKFDSVRLEMLERKLCFDAAANLHYTLYYGDAALSAPVYDYARLFSAQPDSAAGAIGPEQPNPAYQSRPDQRPFTEKHPALLWFTLLGVIALLGAIALRSSKRAAPPAPGA